MCHLYRGQCTIYLTILVTVNRYVSVCWPYRASELCSLRTARLHVAAITLFAIVFNLPRYFEFNIVRAPLATAVADNVTVWNSSVVSPSVPSNATTTRPTLLDSHLNNMYLNVSDVDVTLSRQSMTPAQEVTYEWTWLGLHPVYRLVYKNLLVDMVGATSRLPTGLQEPALFLRSVSCSAVLSHVSQPASDRRAAPDAEEASAHAQWRRPASGRSGVGPL